MIIRSLTSAGCIEAGGVMGFRGRVLVVDDDEDLRGLVSIVLSNSGYEVATASRGDDGAAAAAGGRFDLVILDMMMPGLDGVAALAEIKRTAPTTEVVMLTAHGSVDTAVESMRLGAFDYLKKPFSITDLQAVAEKALEKRRLSELVRAAVSSTGPNGLMEAITASALSLLAADEALVLIDSGGSGLRLAASAGLEKNDIKKERFSLCVRWLELPEAGGHEPLALLPASDPRFSGLPGARDLAAAIFIPLAEGGALCVCRRAGAAFGETELRSARNLAPMISLAVRNSELNGQLREVRVQLAQTQKMESLGLLAGQISHDFNNLLAVIIGSVQLLMENMRPGTGMKLTEGILQMSKEAEAMIRQLLLFSRKDEGAAGPLDLNAAIDEVKLIIGMMTGKNAQVEYRQDRSLPKAKIRTEHFKQVVLNLAANAGKASPEKGRITITTRRGLTGEDSPAGLKAEDCVVLEVADEGPGIRPENLDRVFEPFFTTKPAGKGTGLGLHIARSVLREQGGDIMAGNRNGGGAVFRVFLPAEGG